MALLPTRLSSPSREADERREPGAERRRAQVDEVVVEIVADGDDHRGADAGPSAAPGEASGRGRAIRIVVPCDDEARDAGRRRERAEAAGGERSRRVNSGTAATTDSTVSMPSPTSSVAPSAGWPNLTAKPWMRPSALRGVATPALAGRRGSSQVRCTPRTALSLPVTAATSAGNRRTLLPSR